MPRSGQGAFQSGRKRRGNDGMERRERWGGVGSREEARIGYTKRDAYIEA